MNQPPIFHLAIPIENIADAKEFYCDRLGCVAGRETQTALILNFYGHQIVGHVTNEPISKQKTIYPRHFGLIFPVEADWENFLTRVEKEAVDFYIPPKLRFTGELTEHRTFFLEDPFHNYLEFKFYRHWEAVFGARELVAIGDRTQ